MKHIKRHYQERVLYKGKSKVVGITIVGDAEKQPDGTVLFRFGAARSSVKDNFVKATGMMLATERFNNYPHSEKLIVGEWSLNLVLHDLVKHIVRNPMYIKEHFKS